LVHGAHRLLSESTLILCTLRNRPVEGKRSTTSPGLEAFQSRRYFRSERRSLRGRSRINARAADCAHRNRFSVVAAFVALADFVLNDCMFASRSILAHESSVFLRCVTRSSGILVDRQAFEVLTVRRQVMRREPSLDDARLESPPLRSIAILRGASKAGIDSARFQIGLRNFLRQRGRGGWQIAHGHH
jgi:hypothetical protein